MSSLDEELHRSVTGLSVVHLSPTSAGALLARLAHLEGLAQRARDAAGQDNGPDWRSCALFVLGDEA